MVFPMPISDDDIFEKYALGLFEAYRRRIVELRPGMMSVPADVDARGPRTGAALSHVSCVMDDMIKKLETSEPETLPRVLGFVEGVLWAAGALTLRELAKKATEDG